MYIDIKMINNDLQIGIEAILSQYRLFSPLDLADHLGIRVQFVQHQDKDFAGAIKKFTEGITIFVNSSHSEKRKLFTIAHELGHFFLHFNDLDNGIISYRHAELYANYSPEERKKEEDANHFAAELLMPKDTFISFFIKNSTQPFDKLVSEMAGFFGVSEAAIKIRMSYLDLT